MIWIRLYTAVPPKGFVLALDRQSFIRVSSIVLQKIHGKKIDFWEVGHTLHRLYVMRGD